MFRTYARIIAYLLEYQFMRLIARVRRYPLAPVPKLSKDQKQIINKAFKDLLSGWKEVLKRFPRANAGSGLGVHLKRYRLILDDLESFLERKNRQDSTDVSGAPIPADCPEYFKRNYHYQTDGYFTLDSAGRYDHQIELLFLGTGHIMRKVAYSVLADQLKGNESVLEFGAGSGTSGFQFKLLYPEVKLDLLDPSLPYLEYAQGTYPGVFNATIPVFMERFHPSQRYDCVFSCFVMHEIPRNLWDEVSATIKDSLKPGGRLLIIDSQQDCDNPKHQFALDQFERDFFEPYFPEYRKSSLEDYFLKQGFRLTSRRDVLFSKALLFEV